MGMRKSPRGRPPITLPPPAMARVLQLRQQGLSVQRVRVTLFVEHGLLHSEEWLRLCLRRFQTEKTTHGR